MKAKYLFLTVVILTVLFSIFYFAQLKAPATFEDMKPRIVQLPERKITGLQVYGNLAQNNGYAETWLKISNYEHQINADCKDDFTYGISLYEKEPKTEWHYLVGCEMLKSSNLGQERGIELTTRTLPASSYVVFTYEGILDVRKVGELYGHIYHQWLAKNGYVNTEYYQFERFDERYLGSQEKSSKFEVFIPIKKVTNQ
ncbi:MAG: GyrI-like domain-containing protein [Alteromonadales bacterium]|nr:GyrI-like domain-containing protein [Alteromonadales bacterium]